MTSRRTLTRGAACLGIVALFFLAGYFAFHGFFGSSASSPANVTGFAESAPAQSEAPYCFLFFRLDPASSTGNQAAETAVLAHFTRDGCKLQQFSVHGFGFGSSGRALTVAGDRIYLASGDAVLSFNMADESIKPLFNPAYKPEMLSGRIHFSDSQGTRFFDPRAGKLTTVDLRLPDSARLSPNGTHLAWIEREPGSLPMSPLPATSWPPSKFRIHLLTLATLKSQVIGEPSDAFEWQPAKPLGTGSRLAPAMPDFEWYDETRILTVSTYAPLPLQPGFGVEGTPIPSSGPSNYITAVDISTAKAAHLFVASPNLDRALFTYVPGAGLVMNSADGAPSCRVNLINRSPIDGPIPIGPAAATRVTRSPASDSFGVSNIVVDGKELVPNNGRPVVASVWIAPDARSLVYSVTDPGGSVLYYLDESKEPRQIMRVGSFAPAMCRWISIDDLKPVAPATGHI
ncbi:MAG TPA: hypothetical protein VHM90_00045 [Phycisphaerae bacterium]|nr:hypothetical protein [Phycisphaerae bacterium]